MFGLLDRDIKEITELFESFPDIEQALIFGSRAKGNYKRGSDVDIALKGSQLSLDTVITVQGILNEDTIMPYHFDVLHYPTLANADLVAHIDRVGVVFYEK